jgi:hypothetical protein
MTATLGERLVVVLAVPAPDPSPVPSVSPERWEAALLADAVDAAESLAAAAIAVLCPPRHADAVAAVAAIDTTVWTSQQPTVLEAAERAASAGARQAVVLASDAPHLPGLLVGKVFRALGRADLAICPDPRGFASAIGLQLPAAEWLTDLDPDQTDVADRAKAAAPRPALVRLTPGWRRLRTEADLAALEAAVDGADFTRALVGESASRRG